MPKKSWLCGISGLVNVTINCHRIQYCVNIFYSISYTVAAKHATYTVAEKYYLHGGS
jgi:hypothetical protein